MDYDKTLEYWEELQKPLLGWCNRPAVIEDLIVIIFKINKKYMHNKYTRKSSWLQMSNNDDDTYTILQIFWCYDVKLVDTMTERIK